MLFDEHEDHRRFQSAWSAVDIRRPVPFSLFTFGESVLPYFLVLSAAKAGETASLIKGEVRITRPTIITADNSRPEFRDFFEDSANEQMAQFLLARTAGFSHLKFANSSGPKRFVSDSVDEIVAELNRQLDDEEEDRTAILTAPPQFAGVALLRYAAERVWSSAPDNIQELRERGFLPFLP